IESGLWRETVGLRPHARAPVLESQPGRSARRTRRAKILVVEDSALPARCGSSADLLLLLRRLRAAQCESASSPATGINSCADVKGTMLFPEGSAGRAIVAEESPRSHSGIG